MTLRVGTAVVAAVLAFASLSLTAADATTAFLQTHYYILPLGPMSVDMDSLRQAAQTAGLSVIVYDGDLAQAFRGDSTAASDVETALSDPQLLVIDGDRFLLREIGEHFTFTVRPSDGSYELVIDPHQDQQIADALGSVLGSMQSLGILGNEVSLSIQAYAKDDLKGPTPPDDAALESTLYSLTIARDWFEYAVTKQLTLVGLRVEVVAEMVTDASLEELFLPYVVEQTDGLVKLSLPIDRLLALARSNAVGYLRTPYHPSVP